MTFNSQTLLRVLLAALSASIARSCIAAPTASVAPATVPGHEFALVDAPSFDRVDKQTVPIGSAPNVRGNRQYRAEYAWGRIHGSITSRADGYTIRLSVQNTTSYPLSKLELSTLALRFDAIPDATTVDYGMFGLGGPHPANQYPMEARTDRMPGVIAFRSDNAVVDYFCDDPHAPMTLVVPQSLEGTNGLSYPLDLKLAAALPAGKRIQQTVEVRFFPKDVDLFDGAKSALKSYGKAVPFQVNWPDRRPIGKEVLATSETHPPTNPRGWFVNDKFVDTTTEAGIQSLRKRILARADEEVGVLKKMGAQGLIVWDVEGEEHGNAVYIGDPRLEPALAPELEYADGSGIKTIDLFFKKFRDAGLRTGVTLRAEEVRFENGVPVQHQLEHVVQNLNDKIAYARKRWGCTLFYVDSTVAPDGGPNDAADFKAVADANPGIILFPENESARYFSATAPLNSFFHHGVADTPAPIRQVWPQAFSMIIADDAANRKSREADLVQSVRHGNILLINSWYDNPDVEEIAAIYAKAKSK